MAAMKTLAEGSCSLRNVSRQSSKHYKRDPRKRQRLTIDDIGKQLDLESSTCRRMLGANGSLSEKRPRNNLTGQRSCITLAVDRRAVECLST